MAETMNAAEISFIGALAVTVVYILHRIALGLPTADEQAGFFLTILISAFIAQYIPLYMLISSNNRK